MDLWILYSWGFKLIVHIETHLGNGDAKQILFDSAATFKQMSLVFVVPLKENPPAR
jgi:creatinine amidohydrolase/Fe(II)-dependent formamide hydrolase-like protein